MAMPLSPPAFLLALVFCSSLFVALSPSSSRRQATPIPEKLRVRRSPFRPRVGRSTEQAPSFSTRKSHARRIPQLGPGAARHPRVYPSRAVLESLRGYENFVRQNPMSDKFEVLSFDHLELWCGDAYSAWKAFSFGLGMPRISRSELSTGNTECSSHVIASGDVKLVFTSPYGLSLNHESDTPKYPFDANVANEFIRNHGTAVRAVGIRVRDADKAFEISIANGAIPLLKPVVLKDERGSVTVSEVSLYGDTVLRYISSEEGFTGAYLPGFEDSIICEEGQSENTPLGFGIKSIDHVVGNVPELISQANKMMKITGFHEFAEFTTEDVGTVDSGLNSLVLANNLENVLLPINEPVHGKRQSQIETYLQHNQGPGVQHIALKTTDIFSTIRRMRERSEAGGFEFMRRPSDEYYKELPMRLGEALTPQQYKEIEELGLLADRDEEGILIQIFTTPVTHRPTLFLEIIQRIGCEIESTNGEKLQRGGCGGFGAGNFRELFKSIEDYEKDFVD